MSWAVVCKLLQKQSFDILSRRYGALLVYLVFILCLLTVFQFSEVLIIWSSEKYAAVFNSFSDNIGGKSLQKRLCLPLPIDVVYTWVNGSDPKLLSDLHLFKQKFENELGVNSTLSSDCTFMDCIPANGIVIEPAIPPEISLTQFGLLYRAFRRAIKSYRIADRVKNINVTMILFDSKEHTEVALKEKIRVQGETAKIRQLFYTSEGILRNAVRSDNIILMSGFPNVDEMHLLDILSERYDRKNIAQLVLHSEKGVAAIVVPNHKVFVSILADSNFTITGKVPTFKVGHLIWDLVEQSQNEDISASRFEDNDELRYSLRSLEKFAPWIRHVFIVTNGQIPSWLNMDNPRLTVVSHSELFTNTSHLPTFSSPAIESHLHRIKGLSDKFVYMNDDVMFGKAVWPDDFYTEANGQKVYLTWPVPNCQDGCPASWIKDGYCDRACNNSDCEWDGGDCNGSRTVQQTYNFGSQSGGVHWLPASDVYCSAGCANNWIADKYCDQSCNVLACGFDAADCGISNFNLLHAIDLDAMKNNYIGVGHSVIYFNYSSLVGSTGSINEGYYDPDPIIRSVSIGQSFKIVTLIMISNHSSSLLNFSLSGTKNEKEIISYNFSVSVDTMNGEQLVNSVKNITKHKPQSIKMIDLSTSVPEKRDSFVTYAEKDKLVPFAKPVTWEIDGHNINVDLSNFELPETLQTKYDLLHARFVAGELTEKGFKQEQHDLWLRYLRLKSSSEPIIKERIIVDSPQVDKNKTSFLLNYFSKHRPIIHFQNPGILGHGEMITSDQTVKLGSKQSESFSNQKERKNHFSRKLQFYRENVDSPEIQFSNSFVKRGKMPGFLPWEKLGVFFQLQQALEKQSIKQSYISSVHGRRIFDTFANSLRHVSRIYNKAYGYVSRKVPAHMAHFIDKHIVAEMQARFPEDWDATSSHQIRSSSDMQFAFSYFYYLMSEPKNLTITQFFEELDADHSGVLSDRELRTLAARLFDLPLDLPTLVHLEEILINCSLTNTSDTDTSTKSVYKTETYYEKRLPQVKLDLILRCNSLCVLIEKQLAYQTKFRHQVVSDDEVAFKMIRYNVTNVVTQLDEVRKHPKKFVCLNDNIDYSQESAKTIKALLKDFYESILPLPSQFELPKEFRNKFLHVDELRLWWHYRDWIKHCSQLLLFVLIIFSILSFFCDKMPFLRRFSRH